MTSPVSGGRPNFTISSNGRTGIPLIVQEILRPLRHGVSPSAALTQRGVESFFPADVVDGPDDLRFVPCGKTSCPHITVAFVIRDVQAVNHGHAAGEFALRFDLHEMLRLRSDDRRIQRDGHSDRVWQRYPVFAGLFEERLLCPAVALDGELSDACAET